MSSYDPTSVRLRPATTSEHALPEDAPEHHEVIVLGAGVAGLGPAWQLADAGLRVLVLDQGPVGGGATSAAAGMLAPTAEVHFEEVELLRLGQLSLSMYPEFVARLQAASGQDVDLRQDGTLVVGLDRDDAAWLDRLFEHQRGLGLEVHKLSGAEAQALEPALHPNTHRGVLCPSDHQVDPVKLAHALHLACQAAGARVWPYTRVQGLWIEQGRCLGVLLDGPQGHRLRADRVLVAAGAWTRQLSGVERRALPHVRPVKGQMLALQMDPQAPLCRRVVRAPEAYLVPKSDGRLIIGATVEEMGFDLRQTAGGVFELLRGAWEAMPGTAELELLRLWSGLRPTSLSNLPCLGPHPTIQDLWLSTGHGRNGILLAAATCALLPQAMLSARLPEPLLPFQLAAPR